jgi:hypothetical protein
MPELLERLHPGAIVFSESIGLRLALPDDDRRVDAVRLIGDQVEAGKPGARCSLGKKSLCARCIVSCNRSRLAFRRSIQVYIVYSLCVRA